MFRALLLASAVFASVHASAGSYTQNLILDVTRSAMSDVQTRGLNWVVGDNANYKLDIGGFIKGTMAMTVASVNGSEAVLNQTMDVMGQKQSCDITLDTNSGEIKKMVCNGQNQDTANDGEIEVVATEEANITVPAGTFECLYIKAINKKDNSEIEQWINPKLVPVLGMIKAIMPSQMGKVTMELTSFKKM